MNNSLTFDYIVVGGGSAGSIVAARLAEEKCGTVLLLEAGEPTINNPETMTSEGFKYAFANDRVMWDRMSSQQSYCAKRSVYMGSGTGLGGSGSVNGMVYTRGDKRDFDQWPQGWQWRDIAPAFSAVEERLRIRHRDATTFTEIALDAAEKVGFKRKNSLNDGNLCGFMGYNDMNFEGDKRRSSYMAFIHNNKPDLLTIKTGTITHRILFDENQTAVGAEIESLGEKIRVNANKEIILCAGALETPKLLMLSGVGPKDQLQQFGIKVVKDVPSIGKNLHDHPNICMFYKGKKPVDFGHPQLYGFHRTNQELDMPEDQADTCFTFMAAPITLKQSMYRMLPAVTLPGKLFFNKPLRAILRRLVDVIFFVPGVEKFVNNIYGVVVILGKPQSRGQLRLASNNVRDQADIDPAFYSDPADMRTMLNSVALAKKLASQQGLKEWGNTPLVAANKCDKEQVIQKWIHGATMTTFHYSGTCTMGEASSAPVDTQLKLKDIKNLRIADASVIPVIPVSAINAPSMMIGYRAADFIIQEQTEQQHQTEDLKVANQ